MTATEALTLLVNTIFVLASLGALRLWLRHRSAATRWLLATFVMFDVVIGMSYLPETTTDHGIVLKVLLVALLVTPYLLFRFADAIVTGSRFVRHGADALMVVVLVSTLLLPDLPQEQSAMTSAQAAWFVLILVFWGGLNVVAGWMLVRASFGEPGVVRNRLRVLAVAAIGLGLYIPASALLLGEDPSVAAEVTGQVVSACLGLLFLAGFAPPGLLRAAWRERDERRLYEAAVGLMAAERAEDVARVMVPGVRALMGSPSVTMRSRDDEVLARDGADPSTLPAVREVLNREIAGADLEIVVAPTMPLFGSDETQHLDRLGLLAELALDRVRLLDAERDARADVERLNEELESFVYTTSHDLKNPVIALIGYLDVLTEDHAGAFEGDIAHIFQRMQVNARHMDSLIRDLLELSRVGRVDVAPEHVDLGLLVDDLAHDLSSRHRAARVERGDLPALWINATRARQLFSNLFDNAVAYGGRDDVTVTVSATPHGDGVRVVVRDDGQGIGDEHLERVFGVFERLDPDRPGGTGMGLAICRRVVENLGGTMRALASPDGAVFQIDLPASVLADAPRPSPVSLEGSTP